MACLDTDILVGLLKGEKRAVEVINSIQAKGETPKTTIITAYELLKGALISSKPQENLAKVKDLLSSTPILTMSYESCEEASKIYSGLKTKGQLIGEFDILIAALVIHHSEALISRDEHFKLIENLNLQTW